MTGDGGTTKKERKGQITYHGINNLSQFAQRRLEVARLDQTGSRFIREPILLHTDDAHLGKSFAQGIEMVGPMDPNESPHAAAIIGPSAILSFVGDLSQRGFNTVFVMDNNLFAIEWVQYQVDALKRSNTREEFEELVYTDENPLFREAREFVHDSRLANYLASIGITEGSLFGLSQERSDLGKQHFLSSQEQFIRAKTALQNITVIPLAIDLRDMEQIEAFVLELKDFSASVDLANVSNIWELSEENEFEQPLRHLFSDPKTVVLYSLFAYLGGGMAGVSSQMPVRGINSYIEQVSSYTGMM